ncbi:MAG: tRNA pseudouridine(55) synthase TruB [Bacteroidales bacterium]|nr:tRNA pseudouridine(55) synthase TruB [Bacteroidales bacterium]
MDFNFEEGEFLLINKPYRWTSFDVVGLVKKKLRHKYNKKIKVGHAGTLDPLATGLLIICTGKFTKKISEFQNLEKEYTGTFTLGATTPCYDMEKPVDKTFPVNHITKEQIFLVSKKLTGTYEQVPPIFSAKQIDGQRAYEYARRGEEKEMKSQLITISEFTITKISMPEVEFKVVCSKGTYIRSLARDFGIALESGAYLSALRRTRIGNHKIEDAYETEDIEKLILSDTCEQLKTEN